MAATGHVKLGYWSSGTLSLKPLVVESIRSLHRDGANPFAAPSGGNAGFNDLEGWSEWTIQDWQSGVTGSDPETGGIVFGVGESRIPGQFMPGPMVVPTPREVNTTWLGNGYAANWPFYEIGDDSATNGTRVALRMDNAYGAENIYVGCYLYALIPDGVTVAVTAYDDTAGAIGSQLNAHGGGAWTHSISGSNTTPMPRVELIVPPAEGDIVQTDANGVGWLVLIPTGGNIRIYACSTAHPAHQFKLYTGSWGSTVTDPELNAYLNYSRLLNVAVMGGGSIADGTVGDFTSQGVLANGAPMPWTDGYGPVILHERSAGWSAAPGGVSWYRNSHYPIWGTTTNAFGDNNISNLYAINVPLGGTNMLYVHTILNFNDLQTFFSSAGGFYHNGVGYTYPSTAAAVFKGQLWLGEADGTVRYTSDTSFASWTTFETYLGAICAMCGSGEYMYLAAQDGLYYVAPGDFVLPLMRWNIQPEPRAVRLINYENSLFVIVKGDVYRVDQSHTILPISPVRHADHKEYANQVPVAFTKSQTFLYMLTKESNGRNGFIWSWQPEGWHCLTHVPIDGNLDDSDILWSRAYDRLFVSGRSTDCYILQRGLMNNPYYDTNETAYFQMGAWFETGDFDSAVRRLNKDFESVYVDADGVAATLGDVEIYFKDKGDTKWTLLGSTSASDETEIRFSNYATKANGGNRYARKSVRLGALLKLYGRDLKFRLNALSTKYLPMVNDRYKWQLVIKVAEEVQGVNNEALVPSSDFANAAALRAHLDACIGSVIPCIFQDELGTQYEVRVTSHTRPVTRYEVDASGNVIISHVYDLFVEQVQNNAYA